MKRLPSLLIALLPAVAAQAAPDFRKEVLPLLQKHCVECHGPEKQKGGFRIDGRVWAFKGGDDGPAIVPGKSAGSPLWQRVASPNQKDRMPPKGAPLPPAQVETLRAWIDSGASWPETEAERLAGADPRLRHWAFQPVREPEVPALNGAASRNPIDAFIQSRLRQAGMQPSPEADRRTLIRRLSYDLLGLPPSPGETESFASDPDPMAYDRLVDRLLASPHYGERWAQHWLDIAHYADTHGFERDKLRDHAWRYRDYVIDSLNADKPYNRFLEEQLAGDALSPNDPAAVVATGFLSAGPWDFVGQVETKSEVLRRAARAGDLDDIVTQVMTSTMGLTVNCARCHDHKIDPIAQEEYYRLWSVFAGVTRGDRPIDPAEETRRHEISAKIGIAETELRRLTGAAIDLADLAGGGDGCGTGRSGAGIALADGGRAPNKMGYQRGIVANRLVRPQGVPPLIRGVFLPNGSAGSATIDGITLDALPKTSGLAWDAIRNGQLNSQVHARARGIDFATSGHHVLGLHANAAIVYDLPQIRRAAGWRALRFSATAGCGSGPAAGATRAELLLYVDASLARHVIWTDKARGEDLELDLPESAHYLTVMAADGGDGIGHDLVFLGDPLLSSAGPAPSGAQQGARISRLRAELAKLRADLAKLPPAELIYGVVPVEPPVIQVLRRGDPESPQQKVSPGGIACLHHAPPDFGTATTPEGDRRLALARWITHPANPLTSRVLVNRLWHYHFGRGIVDTPSDFGLGGGRPSHPELLDWLALQFQRSGWSLKAMHRLICTSAAYKQSSLSRDDDARLDADNRLLWRQNPRRLDAESLHDAVLAVAGNLNTAAGGPGFRDFNYTEAYAPIYEYVAPNRPELWRRSIYRFVVRTTPQPFLATLDCPNPANLTPARVQTTTALQALALSHNEFMLRQARVFADTVAITATDPTTQCREAFARTFQREASPAELTAATEFVRSHGLFELCLMLLNSSEFLYID